MNKNGIVSTFILLACALTCFSGCRRRTNHTPPVPIITPPAPAPSYASGPRNRAALVGIERYIDPGMNLSWPARKDVPRMKRLILDVMKCWRAVELGTASADETVEAILLRVKDVEVEVEEKSSDDEYTVRTPSITLRVLTNQLATDERVKRLYEWCLADAIPGDIRVPFYSGHGAQVPVKIGDGTEGDRLTEVLVVSNFDWQEKMVTDNWLNDLIQSAPKGASVWFNSDSCFSGDLVKRFGVKVKTLVAPEGVRKRVADAASVKRGANEDVRVGYGSGCREDQVSIEDDERGGWYTFYLDEAVRTGPLNRAFRATVTQANTLIKAAGGEQTPQSEGAYRNNPFMFKNVTPRRARPVGDNAPVIEGGDIAEGMIFYAMEAAAPVVCSTERSDLRMAYCGSACSMTTTQPRFEKPSMAALHRIRTREVAQTRPIVAAVDFRPSTRTYVSACSGGTCGWKSAASSGREKPGR